MKFVQDMVTTLIRFVRLVKAEGTISVLYGTHSIIHIYYVIRSWIILYKKWPSFSELICIILHDVGHIGKNYLSNYDKKKEHWRLGAYIAFILFGFDKYYLLKGHCPSQSGHHINKKLFKADKYSWYIAHRWFHYWYCISEPKITKGRPYKQCVDKFYAIVKDSIENNKYIETHNIFLDRKPK